MTWSMKKGVMKHTIFDKDHRKIAQISRKMGRYDISDGEGAKILSIVERKPCHLQIIGSSGSGNAEILLAKESSYTRPPRAEWLMLQWRDGDFRFQQSPNRGIRIFQSELEMGIIGDMWKRTVTLELHREETPEFAALLFALAHRMFHEDDIDIV